MNRIAVLGVGIDNLTLDEAAEKIENMISAGKPSLVVTANPEIIMLARRDKEFAQCLREAGMVTADGIGVVIAARLLGYPIKERVTGIDLVTALFARAANKGYSFYFVGARPGVAERAAEKIKRQYPGVNIVGVHHGYFQDDSALISDIAAKKPDILLVAMGMGKQERWIRERVIKTGVSVSIGVGGSFDVFSGESRRAPLWMRRAGLEWLYRLIKQPSRIGRMMQLPKFLLIVIASRLRKI